VYEGYYSLVFSLVFVDVASAILSYFIVNQIAKRTVNNITTRVLWWIIVFILGVFLMTVLMFSVMEMPFRPRGLSLLEFPIYFFWLIWTTTFFWFGSYLTPFFVATLLIGVFVEIFKADASKLQKRGVM